MIRGIGLGGLALAILVLLQPAARPVEEETVRLAIDRGIAYLRTQQQQGGSWVYQSNEVGPTSLAGLTMLECGVAPNDPQVERATLVVRQLAPGITDTYGLALAILFLDRLGEDRDHDLIQLLGLRLLAGQNERGPWTYTCPIVGSVADVRRLQLRGKDPKKGADDKSGADDKDEARPTGPRLPRGIEDEVAGMGQPGGRGFGPPPGAIGIAGGDHSNTQFAILGLWAARRHGLTTDKALARVERHFRAMQNADGGWSYIPMTLPQGIGSTPAMTCAGLLGLAVGYGVANDAAALRTRQATPGRGGPAPGTAPPDKPGRDPARDPAVKNGLLYLGSTIGHPSGRAIPKSNVPPAGPPGLPPVGGPPQAGLPQAGGFARVAPGGFASLDKGYYFLWSLERVAVAYGLETIGNKDWYGWGAEILLLAQDNNGGWHGQYADGGVDTCFALLFLRRANLAKDLTRNLRGKVTDPGEVHLKSGGVGGDKLQGKKPAKPAVELKEKGKDAGTGADTGAKDRPGGSPPRDPAATTPNPPKGQPPAPPTLLDDAGVADQAAADLIKATGAKQDALIAKLRDGRGVAYTKALAEAIPSLSGPAKSKAREALAERLARMTVDTLRDKFQDKDAEIRRAAALASATKEDKQFVGDLIGLLSDSEGTVVRAAHAALKALTRQDFGPAAGAGKPEVDKAITRWKAWWARNGGQ
jgi:hypothetical protein